MRFIIEIDTENDEMQGENGLPSCEALGTVVKAVGERLLHGEYPATAKSIFDSNGNNIGFFKLAMKG